MRVIKNRLLPAAVADSANFTGRVWRSDFLTPDDDHSLAGLQLSYEPARGRSGTSTTRSR